MFEPVLFEIILKIGSKRTPFTNIMSQASSHKASHGSLWRNHDLYDQSRHLMPKLRLSMPKPETYHQITTLFAKPRHSMLKLRPSMATPEVYIAKPRLSMKISGKL